MTVLPIRHFPEGSVLRQKTIYELVKSNNKVTREELVKNFGLAEPELQTQLATLRYHELVKGYKENGRIYLVPFD